MDTSPEQLLSAVEPRLREALVAAYGFPDPHRDPHVEPGLVTALERLSEPQRLTVIAVHSLGWSLQEVADYLDVSHSTVRTHMLRGMKKLRSDLEVHDAN